MSGQTVTVVIPTLHRPNLVLRAVASVLKQTYSITEVIVVVDGPDPETVERLREINDSRIRIIQNERSLTAAGARNVGVSNAVGAWIAFLDDDDEWLPEKIEKQLTLAEEKAAGLVTCLSNIITPSGRYVWPETIYDPDRRLDEYLFDRRSVFGGQAFMQTSSYLVRTDIYRQAPFRVDSAHDDWHFLLVIANELAVRIETVPLPLANIYMEEARPSLSHHHSWRASLSFANEVKHLMCSRAYTGFCLVVVGSRAASARDWAAFPVILFTAFRRGLPSFWQLATYFAFWAIPLQARRKLRARFRGIRAET
jgi:glycosyltransferase involved in cell wall biosynthesis